MSEQISQELLSFDYIAFLQMITQGNYFIECLVRTAKISWKKGQEIWATTSLLASDPHQHHNRPTSPNRQR